MTTDDTTPAAHENTDSETDDETPTDPEVEGHLLSNPYLLEKRGGAYREQMLTDISYERSAGATPDRGPAKRLLDKVRGQDNG